MKKIIILLLMVSFNLSSQDLFIVDEIIKSYPLINSIEDLAKKIDYDFNSDLEKAKAAYSWLALNIDYYTEETVVLEAPEFIYYSDNVDFEYRSKWVKRRRKEKIILETFKTRKAVCEGYALSFKKICDLLNIENELITGYVKTIPKQIGHLAKNKNHAWNAVKINNNWVLLDVTFGSGYMINGNWKTKLNNYYFKLKKEELNLTHYPSEKKWLDFMNQKALNQFCEEPIFNTIFLASNAKLLFPRKGTIIIQKRKDNIQLKLKDIKLYTTILYSYNSEKFAKKPTINSYGSRTEIIINSPYEDSDLNIFFNNKLAIQYKVIVK